MSVCVSVSECMCVCVCECECVSECECVCECVWVSVCECVCVCSLPHSWLVIFWIDCLTLKMWPYLMSRSLNHTLTHSHSLQDTAHTYSPLYRSVLSVWVWCTVWLGTDTDVYVLDTLPCWQPLCSLLHVSEWVGECMFISPTVTYSILI